MSMVIDTTESLRFLSLEESSSEAIEIRDVYPVLALLIGEPYRHALFSYGDELTLHFGDLRQPRSKKLRAEKVLFGSYILSLRYSAWLIKPGDRDGMLTCNIRQTVEQVQSKGKKVSKEDVETGSFVKPGAVVITVKPFLVPPKDGWGFTLTFSDGSHLVVLPLHPSIDDLINSGYPPVSDWELLTPNGTEYRCGPGPRSSQAFLKRVVPHRPQIWGRCDLTPAEVPRGTFTPRPRPRGTSDASTSDTARASAAGRRGSRHRFASPPAAA